MYNKTMTIKITEELRNQIEEVAQQNGMSSSALVRSATVEKMRKIENEN